MLEAPLIQPLKQLRAPLESEESARTLVRCLALGPCQKLVCEGPNIKIWIPSFCVYFHRADSALRAAKAECETPRCAVTDRPRPGIARGDLEPPLELVEREPLEPDGVDPGSLFLSLWRKLIKTRSEWGSGSSYIRKKADPSVVIALRCV